MCAIDLNSSRINFSMNTFLDEYILVSIAVSETVATSNISIGITNIVFININNFFKIYKVF